MLFCALSTAETAPFLRRSILPQQKDNKSMKVRSQKHLLNTSRGEKPSRYPIWFLRQAGRYLPEYRKIRSQMSFLELCQNPQKAAEVTLQPLKRFDLDGAIIFSDILIIPAYMGQQLSFDAGHGPKLQPCVRTSKDLTKLKIPNIDQEISFLGEAIALSKSQLAAHQTMIGFAGAPFTVASYMIEGSGSKNFSEVKKLLYQDPDTFVSLLEMLAEASSQYLKMQIKAGAEVIMLFDTWAGNLTSADYREYVLPSLKSLLESLQDTGTPVIYYSGQGGENLAQLQGAKLDVLAVDWRVPLSRAAKILHECNNMKVIQGNLDPMIVSWGDESLVRAKVREVLDEAKKGGFPGHIFNVGHGVLPSTSCDALNWVIDEVHKHPVL